ncbi:hypothetical protein B0I32_13641 [Nonomuraea fuscirosea]|uniref:Uncharacterized protein n=1 Tax=Nonomuraea fuscirosea TaxID=1291556 RepID=A0A2T0M233_9ACTN|nr:hypothetical protein [Nonomuraea fuscirosea]PRX50811.1 hypothetical protein B0I32_13641 [Nonomuraea fuscirosea]
MTSLTAHLCKHSPASIRRRLLDGSAYRIVEVPHRPRDLERRPARTGWRVEVHPTFGPFYWGAGSRA